MTPSEQQVCTTQETQNCERLENTFHAITGYPFRVYAEEANELLPLIAKHGFKAVRRAVIKFAQRSRYDWNKIRWPAELFATEADDWLAAEEFTVQEIYRMSETEYNKRMQQP